MMETMSADLSWLDRYVYSLLSRTNGSTMLLKGPPLQHRCHNHPDQKMVQQNSPTYLHSDGLGASGHAYTDTRSLRGEATAAVLTYTERLEQRQYLMNDKTQCYHYPTENVSFAKV